MQSVNSKIIVRVDIAQKERMLIGGKVMQVGNAFEVNYREKSPVVAEVVTGNQFLKEGDFIVAHHNHFYAPSPYHLYNDLFSIPANHTIFATIDGDGNLHPVYGNLLCNRVYKDTILPVPVEQRELHVNILEVADGGWTVWKPGQIIFTRPHSYYEIIYNWNGEERRINKCRDDMVCGALMRVPRAV